MDPPLTIGVGGIVDFATADVAAFPLLVPYREFRMTNYTMQITGMSCGHCVQAVRKALESVPGVSVDRVIIGAADVTFDESSTTPAEIQQAVEDEGYAVADAK